MKIDKKTIEALKTIKNIDLLVNLVKQQVGDNPKAAFGLLDEINDNIKIFKDVEIKDLEKLQGKDGKTPELGVDYFTPEELDKMEEWVLSLIPELPNGDEILKTLRPYAKKQVKMLMKQYQPKDGKTPTAEDIKKVLDENFEKLKGEDGSPDTPDQVIEKIHQSKKKISKDKISGIKTIETKIRQNTDDIDDVKSNIKNLVITETKKSVGEIGSGDNIYTADGTLTENRDVNLDGNDLGFDTDKLFIDGSNGNVGISTTAPVAKLDVDGGNNTNTAVIHIKGNNGAGGIKLNTYGSGTAGMSLGNYSGRWTNDYVNGGGLYTTIRGTVGALSTRSAWDLSVDGGASGGFRSAIGITNGADSDFIKGFQAGGSPEVFNINYNGGAYFADKVGIGATAPTDKLHIAGDIRIEGALKDSNNEAGIAGQILSTTATGTEWIDSCQYCCKWSTVETTDPTATDDSTKDYCVGARWWNTTDKKDYICIDNTENGAIWELMQQVAVGTNNLTDDNGNPLTDDNGNNLIY